MKGKQSGRYSDILTLMGMELLNLQNSRMHLRQLGVCLLIQRWLLCSTSMMQKLDYEEFANFFANKGSGNNPNVNPVFGITREPPNQVVDKVKKVLK